MSGSGKGILKVIVDGPRDPQFNMALDEALWLGVGPGQEPILRLYTWRPTGVTVGRGQSISKSVNLDAVSKRGWKVARRPTGGLALIHAEGLEITYSIVLPSTHPLYGEPVGRSAALIAEGIRIALENMGISSTTRMEASPRFGEEGELCLLNEGSSDIIVEGRKVSGSAQVRGPRSLLQHGTLMIEAVYEDWHDVIKGTPPPPVLEKKFAGLRNLGYGLPSLGSMLEIVVDGFSQALSLKPVKSGLDPTILEKAERLYIEKHSLRDWIFLHP